MRMRIISTILVGLTLIKLSGCASAPVVTTAAIIEQDISSNETSSYVTEESSAHSEITTSKADETEEINITMRLKIGNTEVPVIWEDNASVKDLKELAANSLTIDMSMYGGFEQVGPVGQSITSNDSQTTTSPGDIVLYSGDQIVIFYGSNTWAYTKLGKINLSEEELADLLSNGDVTITLSLQ